MKLISWNVNGLRACMTKGFADFMTASDADIFCVQETKMQREQATFDFCSRRKSRLPLRTVSVSTSMTTKAVSSPVSSRSLIW